MLLPSHDEPGLHPLELKLKIRPSLLLPLLKTLHRDKRGNLGKDYIFPGTRYLVPNPPEEDPGHPKADETHHPMDEETDKD